MTKMERVWNFLRNEIWPNVPQKVLGRHISKRERERVLGYGPAGV